MGYIFESEIEVIMNAVRVRTIAASDSIRLREILRADIHSAVKAYFKSYVERNLQQERALELRSKKFPYSLPEVASLQRHIDLLLVSYYQFDEQEFETVLDESVHFQFNFLCRPQWTLLNFTFGDRRRMPISEIRRKLQYCVDYTYFTDLIQRYFVDRGLAEITYEEFKTLLQRIDEEVVSQHSSLELARMSRAMFVFIDSGQKVPHTRFDEPLISINAAIVFFEDKQLDDIKARLEQERDRNDVKELSVFQLANLIEKVRTKNEDATVEIPFEPETMSSNGFEGLSIVPAIPVSDVVDRPQPAHSLDASAAGEERTGEQAGDDSSPLTSMNLFEQIPESDRKLFVRKIFHRDEGGFHKALEELTRFKTWEEASLWIDGLFTKNGVDPFSNEAVRFTDRMSECFSPPGS